MGGAIGAESEEGKGSTFRIWLTAEPAALPSRPTVDDALPQLLGKRVLVVDDNATNREIVTRHARAWQMEPVAVEGGAEALALLDAGERVDIAVLDMMMPRMDGIELAREIRRRRSRHELPLLLLTSLGRLPQTGSSGEFDAQLTKPLRASQLYNALVRLLAEEDEPAAAAEAEAGRSGSAESSLRILLAEDNAMNQQVALRLLERLGYAADVASNGLEAIAALERRTYDVVLMDVQMPELDGLDASRRICERWPDSRPRIIAMTANALPEDRDACFAAGMDDYVAKPIRTEVLAEALRHVRPVGRGAPPRADDAREFLDGAALDSLRELGGDDFLAEVIDTFLADVPMLLATLRDGLEDGDAAEVRRAAHTLKSNGSTLGATEFAGALPGARTEREGRSSRGRTGPCRADRRGARLARDRPRSVAPEGVDVNDFVAPCVILIADDNRMNRLLLGRSLEPQGHTIVFAEHGREALDLLRRRGFDVLLLDVMMPELDGYGVLEELKGDVHLRDIPVIMTSALDELDSVVKCVEMGAEDYLTKPINPVLLNARVNASVEKKRLRDQQRELISKFATKEVADDLLTSGFALGGKHVDATAMFCDIRSFTSIAEEREPAETIELLNDYYTLMMDAIGGEGGIVNQMIGDGLMAIFGAPAPSSDHRLHAVLAARQMVELIRLFNAEQAARDKVEIEIGVGIASGQVIAGYTGTQHRATYTCVGDTVNVAARLEAHTKELGRAILIDDNTRAGLHGDIAVEPHGELPLKGKQQPVKVFAVLVESLVANSA